jgi:hypothetical protein
MKPEFSFDVEARQTNETKQTLSLVRLGGEGGRGREGGREKERGVDQMKQARYKENFCASLDDRRGGFSTGGKTVTHSPIKHSSEEQTIT